ncbi:activin receptor type-1-like [Achroia grisella]|uniref:activin receptor type-1-like n=1 Tax=Achroia grisella TaxID=688607 RepID=UPI0027D22AA6|nr:activin receptor type-1-like [Achroia grisella]
MADAVILRYLFTFLLINSSSGLPGLVEDLHLNLNVNVDSLDDDSSPITESTEVQHVDEPMSIDQMMVQQPRMRKFRKRYKCHQCEHEDCDDDEERTCSNALYCFKATVRAADGALQHSRGCTQRSDHYQFTCRTNHNQGPHKRHAGQLHITCCRGDMCNNGSFPALAAASVGGVGGAGGAAAQPLPPGGWGLWGGVVASVLVVAAIGSMAIFVLRRTHRLRVSRSTQHKLGNESNYFSYSPQITSAFYEGVGAEGSVSGVRAVAAGDSTLREYLETSQTSGSGSGLPLMVQRTLAKQVTLLHCVGKGRYGEVWRGAWCADSVAVRIYFSRDEARWRRETEVYSTALLRHDNLLAYVGSDMTSRGSCTQLWLITHFHPLGSLYEHLNRNTLTRHQMMVICLSIINGLLHLHTEIYGTQGKPAIAHRDIKSKNILMKVNGECAIADLGLAATRRKLPSRDDPRQGTPRYMSPELLDDSIDLECFESLLKCDVYALALVVWEVTRRTEPARDYRPPYYDLLAPDPRPHHVRKVVCGGARPHPPHSPHPTMVGLANLMRECWHQNPSVRLPALRIKKTLLKLAAYDNSIHLDDDNEVSV